MINSMNLLRKIWTCRQALTVALAAALIVTAAQYSAGRTKAPKADQGIPDLGVGASLHGKQVFPPDAPWNQDISQAAIDPNSDKLIASIGANTGLHADFGTTCNGAPNGVPYVVVSANQPKVPITFYENVRESDPGPFPIPPGTQVQSGNKASGDRHLIIIDGDNWILYEMFGAYPLEDGKGWRCGSAAVFDLNKASTRRPRGWTSADAAGLPIFAGLVRYDEVFEQKQITHALRFTIEATRRAYVAPAGHCASTKNGTDLPPMGMRVRLKANFNISGYPPEVQTILTALKRYGMIVADNGANWFISGAPDPRWSDQNLHTFGQIKGLNFEVIKMDKIITN